MDEKPWVFCNLHKKMGYGNADFSKYPQPIIIDHAFAHERYLKLLKKL